MFDLNNFVNPKTLLSVSIKNGMMQLNVEWDFNVLWSKEDQALAICEGTEYAKNSEGIYPLNEVSNIIPDGEYKFSAEIQGYKIYMIQALAELVEEPTKPEKCNNAIKVCKKKSDVKYNVKDDLCSLTSVTNYYRLNLSVALRSKFVELTGSDQFIVTEEGNTLVFTPSNEGRCRFKSSILRVHASNIYTATTSNYLDIKVVDGKIVVDITPIMGNTKVVSNITPRPRKTVVNKLDHVTVKKSNNVSNAIVVPDCGSLIRKDDSFSVYTVPNLSQYSIKFGTSYFNIVSSDIEVSLLPTMDSIHDVSIVDSSMVGKKLAELLTVGQDYDFAIEDDGKIVIDTFVELSNIDNSTKPANVETYNGNIVPSVISLTKKDDKPSFFSNEVSDSEVAELNIDLDGNKFTSSFGKGNPVHKIGHANADFHIASSPMVAAFANLQNGNKKRHNK